MASDEHGFAFPDSDAQGEEPAEIEAAGTGKAARSGEAAGAAEAAGAELPVEVEELEAVEEAEELRAEPAEGADDAGALAALVKSGAIKAWTIEQLAQMVEEGKSAIVMEGGVFRIKEEVYTAGEREGEKRGPDGLRELASEVVQGRVPAAALPPAGAAEMVEEAGIGGIGDLLRDEDVLDLSKVVSPEKSAPAEDLLSTDQEKTNPIHLKHNGLDYDAFLSSYPRSFTHTTQMKSLVEMSRRVSAVSAGLLLKKASGFMPDLTVGLGERSVQAFHFELREPFSTEFLQLRKAVVVNKNPSEIGTFSARFDGEDIRYMKRLAFMPAVFRGQEGYLFLSFTSETDITPNVILSKLIVK